MHSNKDVCHRASRLLAHFRKFDNRYRCLKLPLKGMDDFYNIPIISKTDLSAQGGSCFLGDVFNVTATSGTTAIRLIITHSKKCHETHVRRLVRLYKSVGVSSRDLCLNLCSYCLNSGGRLMEAAYKSAGSGVIPLGILDSPAKVDEALDLIKRLQPTVVNSYTNQLFDLFSRLDRKHSIRSCIVNGEPLSASFKARIEKIGGVKVFDHYGAMEVSGFAIAQKHTDEYMKIFSEGLFVEVLNDDGSSSATGQGAILVTDLENRSMPFVRYKLGDRVEIKKRKDGLYVKVLGRLADSFLIDGQVLSVSTIVRAVQDILLHPRFFFLIEKERTTYKDRFVVNLLPTDSSRVEEIRKVIKTFFHLGERLSFRFHGGELPKTTSGKFKHIIDARKDLEAA